MSKQSDNISVQPQNLASVRPSEAGDEFRFQPEEVVDGASDPGELPPFDPINPDASASLGEFGFVSPDIRPTLGDVDIPDCIIWVIDGAELNGGGDGGDLDIVVWDLVG